MGEKRFVTIAITLLICIWVLIIIAKEGFVNRTKSILETTKPASQTTNTSNTYGRITNKVALITDTQYTSHLIPLILHFHTVLGPDWPIVFYTSTETLNKYFSPDSPKVSAIFRHAVDDGRIEIRTIPDEFDLAHRNGVNIYLSRPWLWEQLAPAQHVLIFQADSMICANSHQTADDFLEWDFIGAPLSGSEPIFNGGLSLRNRTMMLDILNEWNNWEEETASGAWTMGGEDAWFSRKMQGRGANLPSWDGGKAVEFSCQFEWHMNSGKREPLGYHKVHKNVPGRLGEISKWCPEISLAEAGILEPST